MYIKFNYKGSWIFYGPWDDVHVQYGCQCKDENCPMILASESGDELVEELFVQQLLDGQKATGVGYTIIAGIDKTGCWRRIALYNCKTYLLTESGNTIEKIAN